MAKPNLIHPIRVIIEQVDQSGTVFDEEAKEPVRNVATKRVELEAQVKWFVAGDPKPEDAGVHLDARGHLLFRIGDLEDMNVSINRQDRITKIGKMVTEDLYIRGFAPNAHYPDQDGASLLKAFFGAKPRSA